MLFVTLILLLMLLFSNDYYFLIKVNVHFKSKTVARELPKGLNRLGITLCLNNPVQAQLLLKTKF